MSEADTTVFVPGLGFRRPGRIAIDGAKTWGFGLDFANPEGPVLNVELPAGGSAKTVTLPDPVVAVRGPWEVKWRR